MTEMGDAIRTMADIVPNSLAIDGGAQGQIDSAMLIALVKRHMDALLLQYPDRSRPIGTLHDQGIAGCVIDLALLEGGFVTITLPPFFTADQQSHALVSAGAQGLLTERRTTNLNDGLLFECLPISAAPVPLPVGTAKISFTSGSTGTPKGICLSANHLTTVAQSIVTTLGVGHAGRHLALLPPGVLLENVAGFYATLLAGGTYVALRSAEVGLGEPFRPDFPRMISAIADHNITSLILVPEYLAGIVAVMELTGRRLPRLTLVAVGGARLSPALIERATILGLPVRQGYGLTECASVVSLESDSEAVRGSVGRPLGSGHIEIAPDGEIIFHGNACLGRIGELRSPGPLATGDIGRLDEDGRLWIEGRKSNLIVTSHGRNISPEWVEGLLVAQTDIAQAMVHGDSDAALSALIVPTSAETDIPAAIAATNAVLPAYAQIAHWQIVKPFTPANGQLTSNGRLKRSAITAAYLDLDGAQIMTFFDRLVAETRDAQQAFLAVPQLQAGLSGQISRDTYVAYLIQAYHHVRHTVPLMQAAYERLSHRPELIAALEEYIAEETGHETWILSDIAAAGGDAEAAARSEPTPATAAMIDHAYQVIRTGNPAAFFGMVYVLEGTSVAMASHGASAVQQALRLPDEAFTYLTSHGALDQEHLHFFADLMSQIDDLDDQQAIIAMARDIFRLFAAMFATIPMEDALAA